MYGVFIYCTGMKTFYEILSKQSPFKSDLFCCLKKNTSFIKG